MQKINLRELYPDMYKTDTFLEVTDEVQAVFLSDKRAEAAHERQMYRYKAQYSLDCNNGIEDAVVHRSLTPEEVLEEKQLRDQLYAAVMELPEDFFSIDLMNAYEQLGTIIGESLEDDLVNEIFSRFCMGK